MKHRPRTRIDRTKRVRTVFFIPSCICGWEGMPARVRSRASRSADDHERGARYDEWVEQ